MKAIEKNFNPDVHSFDQKIKLEKDTLIKKLNEGFQPKKDSKDCSRHSEFIITAQSILKSTMDDLKLQI